MERLEIGLLGGFELRRDGRVLDPLALRAARSLFAFLVLNRERAHTRDLLAGTFWPDFDEPRARRRLSQALWQTQKALGAEDGQRYIIGTSDTVRFNPDADFWLDVDEFVRAIDETEGVDSEDEAEALERAVVLYRGDLLAGFYDDWLFHDQDRLRTKFLSALERLADLAVAGGSYETALLHARRLAQENEFDEEAHRRVMRIAVLLGRHNEALRQFEECRRVLAEELGAEPSAETVEMYEAALADRDSGGRGAPAEDFPLFGDTDVAPFVGREAERTAFAERLDQVLEGSGRIVLVEGESGVGKTRLLREVAADAQWRGMDIIWGRSTASGGRPFGPIGDALRSGLSDLRLRQMEHRLDDTRISALAPLMPRLSPEAKPEVAIGLADEQARMYEAIGSAFQAVAATNATLVVLEDVHWADEDTLQALEHLSHRIKHDRIFFAVTYRHGEARERSEVWDMLRSLDRLEYCERISLAALTPAQTEDLIRRSLGRSEVNAGFSERLHRDTGGVPLFVLETLRAMYETEALAEVDEPSEGVDPSGDRLPISPTVHALIRQRLASLEPPARRTIEFLAAHSGDLSLAEVVAASDLADSAALAAMDDLSRRRFLESSDDGSSLGHELVRRVIYEDMSVSRRLDVHRRLASALESHRPDESELLAFHFGQARMPDKAAHYLEVSAERAMVVHAYDAASSHLALASVALREMAAGADRQYRVAALHEEVLGVLGRRDEQEEAVGRLRRFGPDSAKPEVLRRSAWLLAHQDKFEEAEKEANASLTHARELGDPNQIVSALTAIGMIACFAGRAAEGVAVLQEAVVLRDAADKEIADARNALGQNLIDLQRFGEAESQLLSALESYASLGDARGEAEVLGTLATMRMERGEPRSAEADFTRAIEISETIGYRHGAAVYRMNLGILYVITNRLKEALDALEEAQAGYSALGNDRGRALVLSNSAWLWHGIIGNDKLATEQVDEALSVYRTIGDERGIAHCLTLLGSISGRSGNLDRGRQLFEEALAMTRQLEDWWLTAQALREMASIEFENKEIASGLLHAVEAEEICREFGMNDLLVGVRALAGRLALRDGATERALEWADLAMREIRPGVELAHLVPLALSEVHGELGNEADAAHYITLAHEQLESMLAGLDEKTQKQSWKKIPNHRAIKNRWLALQPRVTSVDLPAIDAPTGRPLTDSEYVPIQWTVHHPADETITDRVARRRKVLQRLVSEAETQGASPTVVDLASAVGSGEATVRRDLQWLRRHGHTIATRGSR